MKTKEINEETLKKEIKDFVSKYSNDNDSIKDKIDKTLDGLQTELDKLYSESIAENLKELKEKFSNLEKWVSKSRRAKWYNKWYYKIRVYCAYKKYIIYAGKQYILENELRSLFKVDDLAELSKSFVELVNE